MRGSAAIHWFGGQNCELSDRCFCCLRVASRPCLHRSGAVFAKGWTDDPVRLKATYVPGDIGFSTKPQLAAEMIERALAAGVPFRWVAADSVYGVGDIERDLRQAATGCRHRRGDRQDAATIGLAASVGRRRNQRTTIA